jgi:lysophospholipase L1-like esterase
MARFFTNQSGTQPGQGQFVSVPYGWDTGYKAAQAALTASGTPIRVWLHGQSIMAGFNATNNMTGCFRWLVRNYLIAKYGRSADYFPVTLSQHFNEMSGVGTATYTYTTPPWLLTVSPLTAAPFGFFFGNSRVGYLGGSLFSTALAYAGMGGDAAWSNPGAGQTIATFQHSVATWLETCQAYDLVCSNRVAGTPESYNVNGAGAVNVTFTADNRIQVIPMATGLAAGRYDTVIKGVGASGTANIAGVTAHATTRGAPGVQIAHIAAPSAIMSNMDSTYVNQTLLALDASTGTVGLGGFPMKPDLVINNMLLTDTGAYSPDVSTQRFAQYVEALRRANPNVSIIFLADYNPNGVTTDSAALFSYALGYPTHLEALLAVAQQLGCAFINLHDYQQGKGVANGYITSGEVHPTDAGHTTIANLVTSLL